ncbi:uncharacterized protein LOC110849247 isoform X2 [Folsomia candida]|uniref:MARVEL domain-containing protein n=1 Tax=Folsomia candida TaxID=158441 RepID=A0A226EGB7_FOLCA|nr:uncharacterized protein LOC110849247 isoform X2 [Folsomia candida]OXA55696.1 hypothetical protein Fcan01_09542 [Folsomia candida]
MCLSVRGAAYYGASLHITIALLFLGGFFVDVVGISEVWHNPYATYFSLILAFIYICLFLGFGLLIFRGVELESVRLLKGSVAGFLVVQISAFLVYLALLNLTHSRKGEESEKRRRNAIPTLSPLDEIVTEIEDIPIITLLQVIALVLGIATTFAYVAVVVTYVRNLCPGRRRG